MERYRPLPFRHMPRPTSSHFAPAPGSSRHLFMARQRVRRLGQFFDLSAILGCSGVWAFNPDVGSGTANLLPQDPSLRTGLRSGDNSGDDGEMTMGKIPPHRCGGVQGGVSRRVYR
jgi:hypothetical protein